MSTALTVGSLSRKDVPADRGHSHATGEPVCNAMGGGLAVYEEHPLSLKLLQHDGDLVRLLRERGSHVIVRAPGRRELVYVPDDQGPDLLVLHIPEQGPWTGVDLGIPLRLHGKVKHDLAAVLPGLVCRLLRVRGHGGARRGKPGYPERQRPRPYPGHTPDHLR